MMSLKSAEFAEEARCRASHLPISLALRDGRSGIGRALMAEQLRDVVAGGDARVAGACRSVLAHAGQAAKLLHALLDQLLQDLRAVLRQRALHVATTKPARCRGVLQ